MNKHTCKVQEEIVDALLSKKALNVLSMEVGTLTPLADSFIVASGNSDIHMSALVNAVTDCLDKMHENYRVEGAMSSQWTLIDTGDLVIHIFSVQAREFYKLERLWGDVTPKRYESRNDGTEKTLCNIPDSPAVF